MVKRFKVKNNNEFNISVIIGYVTLFVSVGSSIMITPFIINNLGASEYGLYMLVYSVGMYLNVEGTGIGGIIIRNIKKHRILDEWKEIERFLFLSFLIFTVFAVVSLIFCVSLNISAEKIFYTSIEQEDISRFRTMFTITTVYVVLMFYSNYLHSIITGYEKFLFIKIINLSKIIFRTLFIVLAINHIKIETLVILDLCIMAVVIMLSAYYVFIYLKVRIKPHVFDKLLFFTTFKNTGFMFVSLIIDNICWNSGSLIIAMTLNTESVGVFSIAMTLCGIFSQLSAIVSSLFLPGVTELVVKKASHDEQLNKMIDSGRYVLILLTLIILGFGFIGIEFLDAYLGSEYRITYYIALPLMISQLYPSIQFVGDNLIQAKNKFNVRSAIISAFAVVSITLSFYLTPILGIKFSWVGIVISTVIFRILIQNIYYSITGLNMWTFFIKTVLRMVLVALCITIAGISLFSLINVHFIIKGIIIVVAYSVLIWLFYLENNEKQKILKRILCLR